MTDEKLKIIYMGTPDFAVPPLQALLDNSDFEVVAIVTQEDKKVGRKQVVLPTPVKSIALEYDIPVLQPPKVRGNKDFQKILEGLESDFFVVAAYGQILPPEILEIPKYGPINIHASLLPLYRGASPITASILKGDAESGISFMRMEEDLDTGPIYLIQRLAIDPKDTASSLHDKLSQLAALHLVGVLTDISEGQLTPIPQNESKASHCGKVKKEDGEISLSKMTAEQIQRHIRAYTPWPSCYLMVDQKKLKLVEAEIDTEKSAEPGQIVILEEETIGIGTKKGIIIPIKVQLEGKKEMAFQDFLRGNKDLLSKLLVSEK